jgi:hypothetical protein
MKAIKKFISKPKNWIITVISIIVMVIFVNGIVYVTMKFTHVIIISISISIIFIIYKLIKSLILTIYELNKYYHQNKILEEVDFQLQNNREIIYNQFKIFDHNKVQLKYVNLLELYVHNVSGEWPDKDIFKITSNSANIRLAQLEEKWLGINR